MKVLHYILGFPPHRSGGLTKYAIDLITSEKSMGHDVYAIWPGNFYYAESHVSTIEKDKQHDRAFIITNALPVPLMYGVSDFRDFMSERIIKGGDDFFQKLQPDVLHVHTLMGLPVQFLRLAKKHNVRIVYTTHDYFGLCLRVNFVDSSGVLCHRADGDRCPICCANSPGRLFLKIRNSKYIIPLKQILR